MIFGVVALIVALVLIGSGQAGVSRNRRNAKQARQAAVRNDPQVRAARIALSEARSRGALADAAHRRSLERVRANRR